MVHIVLVHSVHEFCLVIILCPYLPSKVFRICSDEIAFAAFASTTLVSYDRAACLKLSSVEGIESHLQ